ncbi:glycosyltransferase family 4 protein [Sphingobium sp. D43FB]|uniref:glycosyltransferase family 4 protein n=1 Tax=Sphingobium sp. D43FB TaxID=2017595 RepID=UPI000BB568E7|nr:glycosyltransferase family 4 protein [Sphingobium sp. D43FB]PBN41621.1 glycosyl transferase [Sphingobium sp. D43FB]
MVGSEGGRRPRIIYLGLRGIGGIQGGVETHAEEIIKYIPADRFEVVVVGRSPYRKDSHGHVGVKVKWLPTLKNPLLETMLHSVVGVLYASYKRADILHVHAVGPNFITPLARALGIKVVATHHGNDYNREKWGLIARKVLRTGEYFAVKWTQACISISPIVALELRKKFNSEIDFIPNGARLMTKIPAGAELAARGLTGGRYIVNVARLVPEKRQLDLIAAFEKANVDGLSLVLVGGADHESSYSRAVIERANANPRIHMTGHISGAVLNEIFGNAGLFVLPSTHEGLPIVLLEAMSFGQRVLLSDLAVYRAMGIPEDVIYPVGDTDALAKLIQSAFASFMPSHVDWSDILSNYQWDKAAGRTIDVYERVLGTH